MNSSEALSKAMEKLSSEIQNLTDEELQELAKQPVSYTHLDVYKRQEADIRQIMYHSLMERHSLKTVNFLILFQQ